MNAENKKEPWNSDKTQQTKTKQTKKRNEGSLKVLKGEVKEGGEKRKH